jgi:hypothetical protein
MSGTRLTAAAAYENCQISERNRRTVQDERVEFGLGYVLKDVETTSRLGEYETRIVYSWSEDDTFQITQSKGDTIVVMSPTIRDRIGMALEDLGYDVKYPKDPETEDGRSALWSSMVVSWRNPKSDG